MPKRTAYGLFWTASQPVARFLPPARQHDRMNVERLGDRLNLDVGHATEFHRRQLELYAVAMHLLRTDRSAH